MGITHEIRRFLKNQYVTMMPVLNEKAKRIWAGSTARGLGYGGITAVSQITGLAPNTVRAGVRDVEDPDVRLSSRIRRPGAGRKPFSETVPTLVPALMALLAPATRGDP